ncbi:transglutaminase-like cysteine peptidase [Uliginosibacterium sediminicola]|uniref:Transglutaminase-like cysteine peptidase n=1 Tax=Uliginosibacterium sediminicola TaxID=2024550 RepID=A0ABU9Z2S7_9RHOO
MTDLRSRSRWLLTIIASFFIVVLAIAAIDEDRLRTYVQGRFGAAAVRNVRDWRESVARLTGQGESERLQGINDFFNRHIQFQDDTVVWGQDDYWATPLEFLGRASGDCEDYAIAKYFSLIELGVPASRMRLIYVRARFGGPGSTVSVAHMVLGYYAQPQADPLILDNLLAEIRPASRRTDLTPVFSFNSDGLWMAGAEQPTAPVDRLSRWKDLLLRMRAEGYAP